MAQVLIAVITCEKNRKRADAVRQTWAPGVKHDLVFADGAFLGVSDDYEQLPAKVKALCRYALANGYEWLLKIDDDTILYPDRLRVPTTGDYIGRNRGASGGYPHAYCSGGVYWLSKKAMEVIANAALTDDSNEDRWVGNALAVSGIVPIEEPLFIAPTHIPKSDYLKNDRIVALMQVDDNESANQMVRWWNGDYDPPAHTQGSSRSDYPVGSVMWKSMHGVK